VTEGRPKNPCPERQEGNPEKEKKRKEREEKINEDSKKKKRNTTWMGNQRVSLARKRSRDTLKGRTKGHARIGGRKTSAGDSIAEKA